jgi:TatD DNase family protein
MYADSHGHWTRVEANLQEKWFIQAQEQSLTYFMEAGVDPEGWPKQIALKAQYPENFKLAFGLHPYFVALHDNETCEQGMNELAKIISKAHAIGETGLDFREPYIQNEADDRQMVFFENQIQLAIATSKPLVLHVVRAHSEALKALSIWEAEQVGGQVHAFNSSIEVAEQYLDLNFLISVGGAITFEKNKKLHEAVRQIPLEKLLLESDCPDQPPEGWREPQNSPLSVLLVAKTIAEIKQIPFEQVLEKTTENFKNLFR